MTVDITTVNAVETLAHRLEQIAGFLQHKEKKERLQVIQNQLTDDRLWQEGNLELAQSLQRESKDLTRALAQLDQAYQLMGNAQEILTLCKEPLSDDEINTWLAELNQTIETVQKLLDSMELQAFLSDPMDTNNAIVTIHAGAGGTEACDWAQMVLRMYTRWVERKGFTLVLQSMQNGDEAGISSVTFRVEGLYAYGNLKAERGVHRLVRISPFDANRKRHTSFCAVDVVAELKEDIEVPIVDKDIRIDVYRASGAGGQHVNKTESAVRITHFPTGIVVTCQNERSQIKNREAAMAILKARLYERMQDEKRSSLERFYGEKGEIGWGYQIRSYVFQPYQMVKDLRTNVETGNVQAVMDGDIDEFIEAWLRAGKPRTRIQN